MRLKIKVLRTNSNYHFAGKINFFGQNHFLVPKITNFQPLKLRENTSFWSARGASQLDSKIAQQYVGTRGHLFVQIGSKLNK